MQALVLAYTIHYDSQIQSSNSKRTAIDDRSVNSVAMAEAIYLKEDARSISCASFSDSPSVLYRGALHSGRKTFPSSTGWQHWGLGLKRRAK